MINLQIIPIFGLDNILTFKKGGGIHIKKKNRGKFTKSAKAAGESVQKHAAKVLSDPNATPLQKKRANFARNAAKWKHLNGGTLSQKDKNSLNKSESIESKVSTAIMNLAWVGKLHPTTYLNSELTRDGGVALRTYLLDREEQRKEFLKAGYIEGKEGDYGLVKKAVGDRNIPIYQRESDAAKREDLIPIGNIDSIYYPRKGGLFHAGNFPTALYYNYKNNKLYLKAWDLNDYGGNTGYAKKYNFLQKLGVNILDKIGSPTVVTSGFLEIPEDVFHFNYNELFPYLKNFYKSKGLEYDFLVDPYKDTPTPHLPEIVVTNKSKKICRRGYIKENNNSVLNTVLKHQQGGIIDRSPLNFVKNDNTRVFKPIIIEKIPYKLKPNELYFVDKKTGKKTLIKLKLEIVSADNRTPKLRKQDQITSKLILKKLEADKNYEKGLETISTLSTLAMPSTYIGPVFNNNGKSYLDNVISGEGTGNTTGNLAIDLAIPFGLKLSNKGISYPYKTSRGTLAIKSSSKSSYNTSGGIKITPESEIELIYPIYKDMKKSKHFKPFSEPYFEELIDNKNVTLLGLLDAGKYSEYLAERIIQNMKNQGFDPDVPSSKIIHNGLRLYGTPSKMIREKSTDPINIYITDEPTNVIGFLLRDNGKAYARIYPNATPEKIRLTTIHEGVSHGTDDVVNTATDGVAADLYGRITKAVKNAGFAKTKGTEQWYELRSTMAEFMAKMFKKYVRAFPGSTFTDVQDAIYKEIDNMSINKLAEEFKSLNSYGRNYGEYLMLNPFEANKFKALLKYGMEISAPIGITTYGFKNN